jgi:hypothetical protein
MPLFLDDFRDGARRQTNVDRVWRHTLHNLVPDQVASHIYGHSTMANCHDG